MIWASFVVAAVLCAIGFYKYVYFLSIGYGFAVAGIGVALLVLFRGQMPAVHVCSACCLPSYGARLSGFPAGARDQERGLPQNAFLR
jgi:hypothetical protein